MANEYFRPGISKARFLPAVASTTLVPTRAEITAGTDLSPALAELPGWELQNNPLEKPNLAERFVGNIPGRDTVGDSALVCYDDENGSAIRTLLPQGTVGFLWWAPYGDVPTKRSEVFPFRVSLVADDKALDNVARFRVGCTVTAKPNTEVTIPA